MLNRIVNRTYLEVLILLKGEVNVLLLDVSIAVPNLLRVLQAAVI